MQRYYLLERVIAGLARPFGAPLKGYSENRALSQGLAITSAWLQGVVKITRVRRSAEVCVMLEESQATINDGASVIESVNTPTTTPRPATDYLSVRHDSTAHWPDSVQGLLSGYDAAVKIKHARAKGNVAYCDGHADYVKREYLQSPSLRHRDPVH